MSAPAPTLRVAALQLSSQENVAENLRCVEELVGEAARRGCELALLPENFAYMGNETGKRELAEALRDPQGPIQGALADLARREHLTLIAGGFPEQSTDPARPHNTSLLFSPDGSPGVMYRKIHLFDADLGQHGSLMESASTLAGSDPVVADVQGFGVGLSICYDLRFPELYRRLVEQGAEVLTVPAAFTAYTGKDHWHVLLRARAIEAQCYVVAAAQWGRHPGGRTTYGHTLIVDPWGGVLAETAEGVGVACADLSRGFLTDVRARLPSLRHRRL
jgi:predicted amidohydrolase